MPLLISLRERVKGGGFLFVTRSFVRGLFVGVRNGEMWVSHTR